MWTLVSGIYNLEKFVCVCIRMWAKEPESGGSRILARLAGFLDFSKTAAKVIPVNTRQCTIAVEVVVDLVRMIEIPIRIGSAFSTPCITQDSDPDPAFAHNLNTPGIWQRG